MPRWNKPSALGTPASGRMLQPDHPTLFHRLLAVVCDDVKCLEISELRVPLNGNWSPVIDLRQTREAWTRDGRAPNEVPSLVSVTGGDSAKILVSGCDLRGAKQPVLIAADAQTESVTLSNNIGNMNVPR
jgi:hypothetical protein